MQVIDFLRWLTDVAKAVWSATGQRPSVTCDIQYTLPARWGPDWFHDQDGKELATGIMLEADINLLLSNHGSVDTSIKDIYITVRYSKNSSVKLTSGLPVQKVVISPRRNWGPKQITFYGSIWGIDKPPDFLRAELVINPLAQRPIRKQIELIFLS
ncbi:MAG: hypothetical protein FJ022_03610 [Chloroflexi bacterium]|nr:hypothetical protein [Chloroflexota bacterium]MBM3175433.1 hypothetical protein [Chloroflexota bacterium]MBM4449879.1 hypothetical protein [Chloroflexota bacterium]MBM4453012.1 hypothetical protein [Chloroflexota bacterium]